MKNGEMIEKDLSIDPMSVDFVLIRLVQSIVRSFLLPTTKNNLIKRMKTKTILLKFVELIDLFDQEFDLEVMFVVQLTGLLLDVVQINKTSSSLESLQIDLILFHLKKLLNYFH